MNQEHSKSSVPSKLAVKNKVEKAGPARGQDLLQALLDYLPDLIYFKDRESRFIRCSNSLAQRFKTGTAEALIGAIFARSASLEEDMTKLASGF